MASSAVILPHFDFKKKFFHHANVVEYTENWASVAGFIVRGHHKGYLFSRIGRLSIPSLLQPSVVDSSTVLPSHLGESSVPSATGVSLIV